VQKRQIRVKRRNKLFVCDIIQGVTRSQKIIFASFFFALILGCAFFAFKTKAETVSERETRLQAELAQVEKEQKETETFLKQTKLQGASLTRDISILDAQIKAAQLSIKAKNIVIEQLGKDIGEKTKHIGDLEDRIARGQESVAQIMRKSYQLQGVSLSELMLQDKSLSKSLETLDEYDQLNNAMFALFTSIRNDKTETETEKDVLGKRKDKETDAKEVILEDQKIITQKEKEKSALLSLTKGQQKAYESVLAQKMKKAAEIRAALFTLRDTAAIPFDKAFQYAVAASQKTSVRPAFLLAILQQESSLGKNVGSCYLADSNTGSGIIVKSGQIVKKLMAPGKPTASWDDITPFMSITKELGLDPYRTLVSCPQEIGWGGAMGPAQFIPSTWMLFKNRIATAVGVTVPDPWRAKDAFMASSIYLGDLGAIGNSFTGEMNAACKYYSGKACYNSKGTKNVGWTYGNSVMQRATNIQENMINLIQGV